MKKLLAVILSVLCIFSLFSVCASAGNVVDDMGELVEQLEEDKEPLLFCITYQNQTLSGVKMMYKPNPTVNLKGPGTVHVTNDTPLAISHDFVCWRDENGKLYYAGDEFYVDGECTLYAVWEEKTDNDPYVLRVIKCAIGVFVRMVQKALGIFEDVEEFNEEYYATQTEVSTEAAG